MNCEKWKRLTQKIKDLLKEEDVTVYAAMMILETAKREIEDEALSRKF